MKEKERITIKILEQKYLENQEKEKEKKEFSTQIKKKAIDKEKWH